SPRSGIGEGQLLLLISNTSSVILPNISDRWSWLLDPSGDFSIKSTREFIDDSMLSKTDVPTRWVKSIPIKIKIFAWRVSLDKLPTRLNLSLRGLDIPSIICPLCSIAVESTSHLLFSCQLAHTGTYGDDRGTLGTSQISGYEEHGVYIINVPISLKGSIHTLYFCLWLLIDVLYMSKYKFAPDLIMLEAYETVESWMIRKDLDPRKLIPTIISELEKMIQIVNSRAYQISEDRNFLEEKNLSFEVVTHLGHGIKIPVIDFSKLNGEEKAMTMAQISIHRTKLKWELFEIVKKVSSECYKTEREEDFFKNSTP
ncbi:RNA-directed DNA polymerase, eukaryota, partial [Tanacetum coccineum]